MSLYDQNGQRKYLTPTERDLFLQAADDNSAFGQIFNLLDKLVDSTVRLVSA